LRERILAGVEVRDVRQPSEGGREGGEVVVVDVEDVE
jgi:hypothetical protein